MISLKDKIRDIKDFPKAGIVFKDITTLLADGESFQKAVDLLSYRYIDKKIDKIVGIEARGFIVGSALAYKLCKGVVLVRKKGKLPYKTIQATYELEYGTDTLEIHLDAIEKGENVLIVDDLIATGGTAEASVKLINKSGANCIEACFIINLTFLDGVKKIENLTKVYSVLNV